MELKMCDIIINGIKCRLGPELYNSKPVSAEGYAVGRTMPDGTSCGCTVAWMLDNGNCPCAPQELAPLTIKPIVEK